MDGSWMKGIAKELENKHPSRVKVSVQLEGGVDVKVHLGKVILAEGANKDGSDQEDSGRRQRSRSRSRGRRGGSPDWSRWKGKSDADMLQELRDRHKDTAVCGHGKSYSKRPLNFDAQMASTALANPAAEAGVDFRGVPSARGASSRREDEADEEAARLARKRQDEDERQRMLATVYKKYCAAPSQSTSAYKEVDTPDVLRLG